MTYGKAIQKGKEDDTLITHFDSSGEGYYILEHELLLWCQNNPDYYKFNQIRGTTFDGGPGGIHPCCELLAKCADTTTASACLRIKSRIPTDSRKFRPSMLSLSKALSKRWKWMDGNPSLVIDKDLDDPRIVVSPVGITSMPNLLLHKYIKYISIKGCSLHNSPIPTPQVITISPTV